MSRLVDNTMLTLPYIMTMADVGRLIRGIVHVGVLPPTDPRPSADRESQRQQVEPDEHKKTKD